MNTPPLLLIDGDEIVWRVAAALEREVQWDEQNHVLYSNADECWNEVAASIRRLWERFQTERHAICFTQGPNFRKTLDETYKANRTGKRKPLCYAELRQRCEEHFNTLSRPGLEADDLMGILATKPGADRKIICGRDKDFKTVPAEHWDGQNLESYTQQEADYQHLYQTLIGDAADGYKGCPGVGPAKAFKLLGLVPTEGEVYGTLWPVVAGAFQDAGLSEEVALTQARLARILRWSDWDQEHQTPILWTPNK